MLWVDKHRPKKLEQLHYHPQTTLHLQSLAANPANLPHLLVYGPSGSGKKTRISCLLRSLFGPGADRLRLDRKNFTTPSRKNITVNLICSNYHIELCPGDAGTSDRFVVQEVIKEMAANKSLATSKKGSAGEEGVTYKVLVLTEVDRLSRQAQAALRRTMEKYSSSCRLILVCNNQSKVIDPVRSRCLGIRVAAPSVDDMCTCLKHVATKERITLNDELNVSIARESDRNLRRAILMLECSRVAAAGDVLPTGRSRSAPRITALSKESIVPKTDWEMYISQLVADVKEEQSPARLMVAREKLYELLVNCIPASVILKTMAKELVMTLEDDLKYEVLEAAAFYEHRVALGSKDIFHLEAFLAKFMAIYKRYLNDMFG